MVQQDYSVLMSVSSSSSSNYGASQQQQAQSLSSSSSPSSASLSPTNNTSSLSPNSNLRQAQSSLSLLQSNSNLSNLSSQQQQQQQSSNHSNNSSISSNPNKHYQQNSINGDGSSYNINSLFKQLIIPNSAASASLISPNNTIPSNQSNLLNSQSNQRQQSQHQQQQQQQQQSNHENQTSAQQNQNNLNNYQNHLYQSQAQQLHQQHLQQQHQQHQFNIQNQFQQQQQQQQQPQVPFQNAAQYTTLSNVNFSSNGNNNNLGALNAAAALTRNPNLLRGLNVPASYENFNSKNLKANKIANGDNDNSSKIYGNAFLGPNLWDKNELIQGEKYGVKFECLDIDEFLNENGFNESDVEFLDHLQKYDANGNANNSGANGTNQTNQTTTLSVTNSSNPLNTQSNIGSIQSSISSPSSASNISSVSSPAASSTPSSVSPSLASSPASSLQQQRINNQNSIDSNSASSSPSTSSPLTNLSQALAQNTVSSLTVNNNQLARSNNSLRSLEQQQLIFNTIKIQQENVISSTTNTTSPKPSQPNRVGAFDWSVNDLAINQMPDLISEFNPKLRKFNDEELKPQPILKKSKKSSINNSIMTSDNSCTNNKSNNNNSNTIVGLNNSYASNDNEYASYFNPDITIENSSLSSSDCSEDENTIDNSDMSYFDSKSSSDRQSLTRNRRHQFVPNELKDDKYWARRRKNNMAAKRSRDARRMKENQIAIRASYLERENDILRKQLEDFKRETKLLKLKLARYETINTNSADILTTK